VALGCATAGTDQGASPRLSAASAPEYDALFRTTSGWTGADSAASVALGQGSVLWLYADSWVGDIRQGKHVNATMIHNSVAIQRGADPATASVEFFYGRTADGKPAALLTPSDERGFFWLTSAVRTTHGLTLLAMQVEKAGVEGEAFGFEQLASWMVAVANPESTPTRWQLSQKKIPWDRAAPSRRTFFGAAALERDGYVYIYGCDEDLAGGMPRKYAVVARVAETDIGRFDQWRFYGAGQWQSDFTKADRLFDHSANELSVSWQPVLGRFLAVYTPDGLSQQIDVRTALRPEGPWDEPIPIYQCPEMRLDSRVFCYAAKGHPELARSADELLVTYVTNSVDFWYAASHAGLYWPTFLRVKIDAAGRFLLPHRDLDRR